MRTQRRSWYWLALAAVLQATGCDIGSILTGGGGRNEDSEVDRFVYVRGEEIHSSWLRTSRLKYLQKEGHFGSPTWSPDGKLIAFLDINHVYGQEIDTLAVMNHDGRILMEPFLGDVYDNLIKWMPDGERLLFLARVGGGFTPGSHAVRLHIQSSQLDTLWQLDPFWTHHTWSPTGDRLYYSVRESGSWAIGYTDVATGVNTVLEPNPDRKHYHPSVSPDGSRIAYLSADGADAEIWIHDLGTGNRTRVVPSPVIQKPIIWSADGSRLAFVRDAQVYLVNADGTGLEQVTDVQANYRMMDWSPKGTEIVFSANIEPIRVSALGAETYVLNLVSDELIMAIDVGLDVDILWKD